MATGTGNSEHECWVTAGQEGGARWGESRVRAWCEGAAGRRILADSAPLPRRSTTSAQVSESKPSGRAPRDPGWREVEDAGGAMWGVAGSGVGTGPRERRGAGWGSTGRPGRVSPRQRGGARWGPTGRSAGAPRDRAVERGGDRPRGRRSGGGADPGNDEAPARGAGASGDQGRTVGCRRTVRRGGDRGPEPDRQRRGSSPARFSQRSSILRMKLPPSPVPGAVGP